MTARAMGAEGHLVDNPQDLAGRIAEALELGQPTVLSSIRT